MKQIIFLCLLSLTLCLSKPADSDAPANHVATKSTIDAKVEVAKEPAPSASAQPPVASTQPPVALAQTPVTVQMPTIPKQSASVEQSPQPNTPPAHTENQKPNTIATTDSNKTTEKKDDPAKTKTTEGTKVETPETPANNTHTDVKPATHNDVKPEEKATKNETSKPVPVSPKPTDTSKPVEPKADATTKDENTHIVQARGFDGPSFIGGIILSLGLLAIGFMGFKYYKNQTERNYHTL